MDMHDFRLFVRECVKTGKADEMIKILIEEDILPPIPQGEWITNEEHINSFLNGVAPKFCFSSPYNCNRCGYSPKDVKPNFCPNCGAKMKQV